MWRFCHTDMSLGLLVHVSLVAYLGVDMVAQPHELGSTWL
jgi:hypothetical protein